MKKFGSCRRDCSAFSNNIFVCNLPSIDRLRKIGEADDYTMLELSKINDGVILDIDYIREEELDG